MSPTRKANLRVRPSCVTKNLLLLGLLSSSACHHATVPTPSGASSFSFVTPAQLDANQPKPSKESSGGAEYAIPPEPLLPLATPTYPKSAIDSPKGTVTIGVRVDIDSTGLVSGIQPSLAVFSTPNSYGSGFREAVEKAVMQWRFLPARLQYAEVVKGDDGREVSVMREGEKIAWSVDVAFTFTASGDVLAGLPSQGKRITSKAPPRD